MTIHNARGGFQPKDFGGKPPLFTKEPRPLLTFSKTTFASCRAPTLCAARLADMTDFFGVPLASSAPQFFLIALNILIK